MSNELRCGFTLIELLTVIAIIAILAAITAVAVPRVLEKAKIADVESDFHAIQTAVTTYMTSQDTYPLGYGYLKRDVLFDRSLAALPLEDRTNWVPYIAQLEYFRAFDIYDRFGNQYDTDRNGMLGMLEYSPPGSSTWTMANFGPPDYSDPRLGEEQRPYVYAAVNKSQFDRAKRAWDTTDPLASTWPPALTLNFPPPRYDAYVLISLGPGENTYGLVEPPGGDAAFFGGTDPTTIEGAAEMLALRTFYLATRDLNDDGNLDFDFRARTRNTQDIEPLPYPEQPLGYGPLIFVGAN